MAGDALDAIEFLSYFTNFWRFVGSRSFRARCLEEWRAAGWGERLIFLLPIGISTVCGLLPVVLVAYFLWGWQS